MTLSQKKAKAKHFLHERLYKIFVVALQKYVAGENVVQCSIDKGVEKTVQSLNMLTPVLISFSVVQCMCRASTHENTFLQISAFHVKIISAVAGKLLTIETNGEALV